MMFSGWAPSGTNGGQTNANPISMDAIQETKWWSLLSMFAKAVLPEVATTLLPNRETTHTMHRSILILRMKVFTESTMLIKIT